MTELEELKVHCNNCIGERKHTVLFTKSFRHDELEEESKRIQFSEIDKYLLVECKGCESIGLIIDHWSSASGGDYIEQYPPKKIKKEPEWLFELMLSEMFLNPFKTDFLREIYTALRNNTPRLAVIGMRALLEQLMIENVGDNGSFVKNLNKFEEQGFLSKIQRAATEPLIEAGHASTHRGFKAKTEEIVYLLDVIENLIESIYVNHKKAKKISVPPRKT